MLLSCAVEGQRPYQMAMVILEESQNKTRTFHGQRFLKLYRLIGYRGLTDTLSVGLAPFL